MIRLLETQVREVHMIFEIPYSDLLKIKTALDLARINYDGDNVEEREAVNYLTKEFYPFILDLVESVKGKGDGRT